MNNPEENKEDSNKNRKDDKEESSSSSDEDAVTPVTEARKEKPLGGDAKACSTGDTTKLIIGDPCKEPAPKPLDLLVQAPSSDENAVTPVTEARKEKPLGGDAKACSTDGDTTELLVGDSCKEPAPKPLDLLVQAPFVAKRQLLTDKKLFLKKAPKRLKISGDSYLLPHQLPTTSQKAAEWEEKEKESSKSPRNNKSMNSGPPKQDDVKHNYKEGTKNLTHGCSSTLSDNVDNIFGVKSQPMSGTTHSETSLLQDATEFSQACNKMWAREAKKKRKAPENEENEEEENDDEHKKKKEEENEKRDEID